MCIFFIKRQVVECNYQKRSVHIIPFPNAFLNFFVGKCIPFGFSFSVRGAKFSSISFWFLFSSFENHFLPIHVSINKTWDFSEFVVVIALKMKTMKPFKIAKLLAKSLPCKKCPHFSTQYLPFGVQEGTQIGSKIVCKKWLRSNP